LPGVAAPQDIQELRRRVLAAAVRTEDVFAQYLAEGKDATVAPEVWSDIIGAGHRLWYSADVIARMETPEDAPAPCAAFVGALAECATTLSDGYGDLAHALRSGAPARGVGSRHAVTHHLGPQASGCARAIEGSSRPKEPLSGVHLFELRSWLVELTDDLRELGLLVSTLGPAPAQGEAPAAAVRDNANKLPATEEATRI
jgi:hypothetical protein